MRVRFDIREGICPCQIPKSNDGGLGISLFDRDLFSSELPTVLSADRVAFIGMASLVLTLIAAAIAAMKAASLEPVDCLNFE